MTKDGKGAKKTSISVVFFFLFFAKFDGFEEKKKL